MKSFALTTTLRGKVLDMEALQQFWQEGVHISTGSDQDLPNWKRQAELVYGQHKGTSSDFKRFFDDKMSFKTKYDDYYETHGAWDRSS